MNTSMHTLTSSARIASRIRWLSATEPPGCRTPRSGPDSASGGRRISSGNTLQGMSPPITFAPTTGETGAAVGWSSLRLIRSMFPMPGHRVLPTRVGEVPGEQPDSFSK